MRKKQKENQGFTKVSEAFLSLVALKKISNRQAQYIIAFIQISQNNPQYHPGAFMKRGCFDFVNKTGVKKRHFQYEWLKDRNNVKANWKLRQMLGVKTDRQLYNIIKFLKSIGVLYEHGDYLCIRNILMGDSNSFVKVPIKINSTTKLYSKGFKTIAFIEACVEAQKGKAYKPTKLYSRKTRYNHKQQLAKFKQQVTIFQTLLGEINKLHLREKDQVNFKSVPFYESKIVIYEKDKRLLAYQGKLYIKPQDLPYQDVALCKRGLKHRWIEYEPEPQPLSSKGFDKTGKKFHTLFNYKLNNKKTFQRDKNLNDAVRLKAILLESKLRAKPKTAANIFLSDRELEKRKQQQIAQLEKWMAIKNKVF